MTPRRIVPLALLFALASAAPAAAAVAPGRVTFPVGSTAKHQGVDPLGMSVGVAIPNGGVVLAGIGRDRRIVLAQLQANGSLDPSFGTGGIARVSVPSGSLPSRPTPLQLLRRPDGLLVLVAAGPQTSKYELQKLVLERLTADGRLDTTFGNGGVAQPGIQASCANCSPASLQPDGSIVVTGNTGQIPTAVEHDPTVKPDFHWVVARVTPSGALDPGFGQQGIAALPGSNGGGYGTSLIPGGDVAVLGRADGGPTLARLTKDGALDPGFHGGTPLTPPGSYSYWFGVLAHPSGNIDVLGTKSGTGQLLRYNASGDLDPAFGSNGAVQLQAGEAINELLPAPDGGDIVAGPTTFSPGLKPISLRVTRVAANGAISATSAVPVPFGGGLATVFARHRAPRLTSLNQTGFHPERAFARPDGGVVLPGAIGVIQYTGEGEGFESDQVAVAAITPALALDPAFGGPARPATITVRVPRQRASTAASPKLLRVAIVGKTSGPGLCQLRVTWGKRVIARSTAAAFVTGEQRLSALLTLTGRRVLRHARHVRVTVTATFKDLVGSKATAKARGTLR